MSVSRRNMRLLSLLFDFSFTEFLTPKIAKALYGLSVAILGFMAILGLVAIMIVARTLGESLLVVGLGYVLFAVVLFLFSVTVLRVSLETSVIFFRIAENTSEIAEHEAEIAINTATLPTAASDPESTSARSSSRSRENVTRR